MKKFAVAALVLASSLAYADRPVEEIYTKTCSLCHAAADAGGTREELLAEAKKRNAENPGTYHPVIYGEDTVGGTNVFVLSPLPFDELGMETCLGTEPMPNLTWAALSKIPKVVGFGAVGLSAIYWITHRREDVAAAEHGEKE